MAVLDDVGRMWESRVPGAANVPHRIKGDHLMSTDRPTIAVDLRSLVPAATGIGVYTRSLLTRLARRNGARYVGLAHRPIRDPEELLEAGVELPGQEPDTPSHRPGLRWPLGVLWQQLGLPRALERLGADLVWSPLQTLPLAGSTPAVVTVYDLTVLLFPETHRLKVRWSQLPLLGRSLARARGIVTCSEATAEDLRFHFPEAWATGDGGGRVRVVHGGVDPAFRPISDGERPALRRRLAQDLAGALGPSPPDLSRGYLLYVGALEPRKNVETLLNAWERLHDRRLEGQGDGARDRGAGDRGTPVRPLLLAGDAGWRNRRLRRRIEALRPHGVSLVGRVDSEILVRLFQGADVFAYPSLYEGFGLPPLEAMACGVPVVASNASSLPEVVGDAGLLVEPRGSEALAAALGKVLDHPAFARQLGERGRQRAARFTWERAAEAMEEILLGALGR